MTDNRQEELLSAYLDAELSSEQQAEVEQLLATQPAARQLLDDLRALSGTLQSLPRERVGQDLSAQVLRRAERAMLATTIPASDPPASAEPATPSPAAPSVPPTAAPLAAPKIVATPIDLTKRPGFEWSLGRSRRGWVWAALTLAAALLLMLFDRNRAPETQLAKAPQTSADQLSFESREEFGEAAQGDKSRGGKSHRDEAMSDAELDSDNRSGQVAQRKVAEVDGLARTGVNEKQSGGAVAPEDKATANVPGQDGFAQNSRTMQKDAARQRVAEKNESGAAPREESVARGNRSLSGDSIARGKGAAAALKAESAPAPADPAPVAPAAAIAAPAVAAQSAQRMVVRAAPAQAALSIAGADAQTEATEILVVQVHVTAEALRNGAFEQVMATQNIHWELESEATADPNRATDKQEATDSDASDRAAGGGGGKGFANDEPPARQAAVKLLKQLAARELEAAGDADHAAEEESLQSNVASAAPLASAPAKSESKSAEHKLAERRASREPAGKAGADIAAVDGTLLEAATSPSPQYAVLVESSAAHLQQTLAQLAADDRFVAVELATNSESMGRVARGVQLGKGGQANGNSYFDRSRPKSRAVGALAPVDGKASVPAAPTPAADKVADQPVPGNKPTPAEPKSDLKSESGELRAARPAAKLQMRSDLSANIAHGQPAGGVRAWRIELPQRDVASAPGEAAAAISGKEQPEGAPVAAKKALGRALPASRDAEPTEQLKRKSDSAKDEQPVAAPIPAKQIVAAPLAEKSKTDPAGEPSDEPVNDPSAPVVAAATAQAVTLGAASQQPVRVLFVIRVAAEPAANATHQPAAGPAPAVDPAPPKQ